jgi:hypothetical protein
MAESCVFIKIKKLEALTKEVGTCKNTCALGCSDFYFFSIFLISMAVHQLVVGLDPQELKSCI